MAGVAERGVRRQRMTGLPWALAAAAVLAQVGYPLTDGPTLRTLTVLTVVSFCAASLSHAWVHRGPRDAFGMLAVTAGGGFLAEAVGARTGVPFGDYAYAGTLGPSLLGVPVVVPLAWTMMGYPAFVVARRLTQRAVPLVGGFALASWDLFLDPQMVAAGHWTWTHPSPDLPGVPGIPLTNYAGWFAVGLVMMVALDRLLPRDAATDDRQPGALFLWTWAGSVLGNLAFFGRPTVAVVGGVVMGLVAVPYARSLLADRPR